MSKKVTATDMYICNRINSSFRKSARMGNLEKIGLSLKNRNLSVISRLNANLQRRELANNLSAERYVNRGGIER